MSKHYTDQEINDLTAETLQDALETSRHVRAYIGAEAADDYRAEVVEGLRSGTWVKAGTGRTARAAAEAPDEYGRAYGEWLRRGDRMSGTARDLLSDGWRSFDTRDLRAMGEATGTAGAQLVPAAYGGRIINVAKMYSGLYESGLPTVFNTQDGRSLTFPVNDDTGNAAAQVAESADVTTAGGGADPTFSTVTLGAWTWAIKPIRVSFQLLQDNAFDLEGWLNQAIGTRMGRGYSPKFITGAGTTEAMGLMTGITAGVTGAAGQTTSIKWGDVVNLVASVDAAYSLPGRAAFLTSPSGLAMLRNVIDTTGRPILVQDPSQDNGMSILGYRVVLDANVAAPAANALSLAFGDFGAAYAIRQVRDVMILRLSERYAEFGQVGFLAFMRLDGQKLVASAVKAYKHSAS
jgi:HK97 family phage major capsid protein